MNEQQIEELLGAYTLDAVDEDERREIEDHLLTCPRCRAEVAAHREVVSLFGNGGADAPNGLWDRIAAEIAPEAPPMNIELARLARDDKKRSKTRRPVFITSAIAGIAAAAVAIALLSVQVANGNGPQTNPTGVALSGAVSAAVSQPHRVITLTSATSKHTVTVLVDHHNEAYWLSSNLPSLPSNETYQVWTATKAGKVVSLGVLGNNPRREGAFQLDPQMKELMVTAEPAGGTPAPTTAVLVAAPIQV